METSTLTEPRRNHADHDPASPLSIHDMTVAYHRKPMLWDVDFAARQMLRNHRLWEMYLIRYADIAPSHVDRDADEIEHVLGDAVVAELEQALAGQGHIPASPHVALGSTEAPA